MAKGLKIGDRVAWHHRLAATVHSMEEKHLPADLDAPGPTPVGVIQDVANEKGTWFSVLLDGDETLRVLTFEELIYLVPQDKEEEQG